jgi:bifunctional non-homologous end joining protein LigD
MSLEVYRKKRNFKTTPEPEGRVTKSEANGLSFIIQKHAASHLHYDFRLELNGVLLSWAVPKGPSLDPNDKRLAMHVEDHPIEYGTFEGVIPPKQYGAGTVLLWDRGTWLPKEEEDAVVGYEKGKLKFELKGEKLRGGWNLVRSYGGKYGDKAWLLIKEDDQYARCGPEALIVDEQPKSVASGRTIEEIAADPDRVWHSNKTVAENVKTGAVRKAKPRLSLSKVAGAIPAPVPKAITPQLATLVREAPLGDDWLHEIKYDGYRMLCRIEDGEARMYSRSGKNWTENFSAVARACARLPVKSAWIDGEVVALQADGRSRFQLLQNALTNQKSNALYYYVFDLLYIDGFDVRGASLLARKQLLTKLLTPPPAMLRVSNHVQGSGTEFLAEAAKLGLEGIISKRANSTYQAGRSREWVKIKCVLRQEMVIGGFTNPEGSRTGFGALLLGVYEPDGALRYSGKVGTGFNEATLETLHKTLLALEQKEAPFVNPPKGAEARRAHWVKPELVAEVSFTEWTEDGTLRNPSFQGLREDKKATEVIRERPAIEPDSQSDKMSPPAVDAPALSARGKRATAAPPSSKADADTIAGIQLTNPTKLLYPEAEISKRDLALYYEAVGERIVAHLKNRPLTLVRCPNGWDKPCFHQKKADGVTNPAIDRVSVQTSDGPAQYMVANSVSAVVALLQLGVLELHPWGSSSPKLGFPDRMIFDLDPDDDLPWADLADAAILVKTLLDQLGLQGFLRTTGGKGLHVVVPIEPVAPWDAIKGFTQTVADLLTRTFPDRFTAKLSRAARRGKIFIDYLRNAEGSTAIASYSIRARANAPVAMPIGWHEIKDEVRFDHFNVRNVTRRLRALKRDPWEEFFRVRQPVTEAMMLKVGYVPAKSSTAGKRTARRG